MSRINKALTPLRLAVAGIFLLSVVGNVFVPYLLEVFQVDASSRIYRWHPHTIIVGFAIGLVIGELVAIAFWMLQDPSSLLIKLSIATFLGFTLMTCWNGGMYLWSGRHDHTEEVCLLIVGTSFPTLFAGLLYLASRFLSPKALRSSELFRAIGQSQQYGIGFVMILMAAVALLAAVIRWILTTYHHYLRYDEKDVLFFVGVWFVWLAIATTLFVWYAFISIVRPTKISVGMTLLLAIFGPTIFQWVVSFIPKIPKLRVGFFDAFPQSIAFGILFASLLLGGIYRMLAMNKNLSANATIDHVTMNKVGALNDEATRC